MPLPTIFAALTDATGQELDNNFAALGALTPIPCAAAGAGTITLAPLANTPSVPAYSNYMQFTGVAALTSTAPTTARVGSLAALPVFKPGASGPVALTGNEIIAGTGFSLMYDAALNSGGGGFHLMSPSEVVFASAASIATATITTALISLASITRLSVGTGQNITRVLTAASSITWAALNPQTSQESIVSLPGCSVGDAIQLGYPASVSSQITFRGYVPSAGSVAIVAQNYSASTITPTPGSYRAVATGFT